MDWRHAVGWIFVSFWTGYLATKAKDFHAAMHRLGGGNIQGGNHFGGGGTSVAADNTMVREGNIAGM